MLKEVIMNQKPASKTGAEGKASSTFQRLRIFNALMGIFHLAQGIAMVILSSDFALPITTIYLKFDPEQTALTQNPQTIGDITIGPMVAAFLFLSALAHLFVSTVGYGWYKRNLKSHMNPARWYEYSLSASLMLVIIAMLAGMYDLSSLIMVFGLNAMMILFGMRMEVHNRDAESPDWQPFIYGCIAGIIPWITIALYLFGASSASDTSIPAFVYGIFASIFAFFNIFALNMVLQYKRTGSWKDYLYGERVYIMLSLFAKSALAWQVFAGTLRPM